jgi:hypothetical protein
MKIHLSSCRKMIGKCQKTFGTWKCHEHTWRTALVCFERVRKVVKSDSSRCQVCQSAWNKSAPTAGFSSNLTFQYFAKNLLRKFKFHQNLLSTTDTLHEQLCAFMKTSQWIILRMIIFQNKIAEKIETNLLFSVTLSSENPAVCEIMWKNMVESDRPQMTV